MAGGLPASRRMSLRFLRHPRTLEALDHALVCWMPAPGSFTGEDQAELHIHGGLAVRGAVLRTLTELDGCRPAEPGEFTKRAFLNGRMDLGSVEGLADLIDAETEAQRRQALRQLQGRLDSLAEGWRSRLVTILALLEAALDFSDESDIPDDLERQVAAPLRALRIELQAHLEDGRRGERLRDGFSVVLAGPPNAGKSTLLNVLARRDVAIVSPVPGTTRDVIEVHCDLDGLPVVFSDTAGIRDTTDPVEREGVVRTQAKAAAADLVLWLTPSGAEAPPPPEGRLVRVATKIDQATVCPDQASDLQISATNGIGIDLLLDRIKQEALRAIGNGDDAVITRERHRKALERGRLAIGRAVQRLGEARIELAAEDVRLATRAVGEITGRVGVEDVLDQIFASFCIGK